MMNRVNDGGRDEREREDGGDKRTRDSDRDHGISEMMLARPPLARQQYVLPRETIVRLPQSERKVVRGHTHTRPPAASNERDYHPSSRPQQSILDELQI